MGFLIQVLGLLAGVGACLAYIVAITNKTNNTSTFKIANYLLIAQAVAITATVLILLKALVAGDFNYVYVASYTDRSLPLAYKLSALWAGQAGSLLFWSWLVGIFAVIEIRRIRTQQADYQSYVLLVVAFTATFFLFLCTFITTPFETMAFIPRDGKGMNPMLQNPGMMIHPPLLYIGFVGFVIPFGHAFASSCKKDITNYWIKASRPWTLITWVFLTAGIVLGAWWAYVELGWGGYWAWDPVENASLFPWITATAFIHAAIIYERKGRLKAWSYFLILITFELTIFGTYLTRSGIMTDSVHSFGQSALGDFFLLFIFITTVIFLIAVYRNRKTLADGEDFNFASKEGVFFIGLLCFMALTLALLFYTMLPVLSEMLTGNKMSVQNRSYNLVSIPFFAAIFFLASIAPVIPYGKAAITKFCKVYTPIFVAAIIFIIISIMLGFRNIASVLLALAAAATMFSFLYMAFKTIRASGISAIFVHRKLFGAIIVHIGLALMAFGVIYSAFYNTELDKVAAPGETVQFGRYTINVGTVEHEEIYNWHADYVPLDISVNGKYLATLYPELREYANNDNIYAEVAYYSMPRGDLYTILQGYDMGQDMIRIKVIFQPLIIWIWIGCILMCIGALYGVSQGAPLPVQKED